MLWMLRRTDQWEEMCIVVCVCVCVCVRGVVRERERKKGLRGFEGKRAREKAGEERRKEVLIFSG